MRRLWIAVVLCAARLQAHEGWGLVIHPRLGVIAADIPGNTIWRITAGGAVPLLRNIHSHALVMTGDGAIYGTNPDPSGSNASVWRFDGRFAYVVPPTPDFPLGLQSFFIRKDGVMYSANRYDHRRPRVVLLRRDPDGSITELAQCTAIDGIRQDVDGSLIIADGASLRRIGGGLHVTLTRKRFGEDLLGLSTIHDGTIHVADHAGRRVLRVSLSTGAAQAVDHSSFLWAPAGVEISGDALYVLEHLRPPLSLLGDLQLGPYLRVRRNDEVLATVWGRHSMTAGAVLLILIFAMLTLRRRSFRAWRHIASSTIWRSSIR